MGFQEQLSGLREKKVAGFSVLHVAVAVAVVVVCVCVGCGVYAMSKGACAGVSSSGFLGKMRGMVKKAIPESASGSASASAFSKDDDNTDFVPENEVIEGLVQRDKKKSIPEKLFKDVMIH